MKKLFLILSLISIALISCSKKENNKLLSGKVQFSINTNKVNSALKSALAVNASSILISIEDTLGEPVYDSEKIQLYNFNGTYICSPIPMNIGFYRLSKFMVLDSAGKVIYATPVKGSPKAYLVQNPLSIDFSISKDAVTKLTPEVLSTNESTPSDFGYFDASFQIVKTFDFLVSVMVYDATTQNFALTNASITISDSTKDLYTLSLEAKTNKITVNDGLGFYKIKVSKSGYADFTKILTAYSLKSYFNKPLVVVLTQPAVDITMGLVAYYPFNGNANDESGHDNNGEVHGATLTNDRFGNANKSYYFNGNGDHLLLPNQFDFLPRSIDLWFNSADINYYSSYGSIYQSDNPYLLFGNSGVAIKDIAGKKKLLLTICAITDTVDLEVNTWYNIAIVANVNKEINFYVNGKLIGTKEFVSYLISVDGLTQTLIGSNRLGNDCFFKGFIDDIRIYNRALGDNEITAIYNLKN